MHSPLQCRGKRHLSRWQTAGRNAPALQGWSLGPIDIFGCHSRDEWKKDLLTHMHSPPQCRGFPFKVVLAHADPCIAGMNVALEYVSRGRKCDSPQWFNALHTERLKRRSRTLPRSAGTNVAAEGGTPLQCRGLPVYH